jgi:anaerobic selenocysteine-containing dehydrogenase
MANGEPVRTFCRVCEVGCGLVAHLADGALVRLRPDQAHPVTQGFACSQGLRWRQLNADPEQPERLQRSRQRGLDALRRGNPSSAPTEE